MRICVFGAGTLAQATAEGCGRYYFVARARVPEEVGFDCDVYWLCDDTPIGPDGKPDVASVLVRALEAVDHVREDAVILLSSQVPIGTTALLENGGRRYVAYVPENIRVKTALEDFLNQSRIVIGHRIQSATAVVRLTRLLQTFTPELIWTSPETAEMCKHALNAYLGLSIAFINEIARIGAHHNINMEDVSRALLTERRISPAAPLKAGLPFGGGHLARDIHVLCELARASGVHAPIIQSIIPSNG